jgi:hypothetical protein
MSRSLVLYTALLAAVSLAACDGNPSGASGAVVLRGTVVGDATAAAFSERVAASRARITVTVQQDPSLSTTVGGNGTFELSGLPEGSFTLVFTSNGVTLGSIDITGAQPGQEIRITVQVTTTTVILIDIVNGDGDDDEDDGEDSDDEGEDEDDGEDGDRACAISGGKIGRSIELEGNVSSGDAAGFELRVNGNRVKNSATVRVTTAGASFKCNGQTTATECRGTVKPSAKVHVKGTLDTCDLSSATVTASEVKVQKP